MNNHTETYQFLWDNITIEVRWKPDWLYLEDSDFSMSHLEIESIYPEREPLPMTETGYRSHFTDPKEIKEYGDPVAFVEAWLDELSQTPKWQTTNAKRKQLSLF